MPKRKRGHHVERWAVSLKRAMLKTRKCNDQDMLTYAADLGGVGDPHVDILAAPFPPHFRHYLSARAAACDDSDDSDDSDWEQTRCSGGR